MIEWLKLLIRYRNDWLYGSNGARIQVGNNNKRMTSAQEVVTTNKNRISRQLLKGWQLYLLLILPLLYLALFRYAPMYGAQIAFKNYSITKGIMESPWVGIANFSRFFHSYDFWRILTNTLLLSLYHLLATFPFPILLALGLNYIHHARFRKTLQLVTYAPHFISVVVMVGLILQFLSPRIGPLASLSEWLGFTMPNVMGDPDWFKSVYVWSDVWQHTGFSCIIFLVALAGIDPALHEAALMDGASKVRRMWHIDLPGIMPIAIIMLILNVGHIFDLGFEKVLLMQNPLNTRTSEIIDTYVFNVGLKSAVPNFSYASAIGLFKNVIAFILVMSVNQLSKKFGQSSLW
ncbi:ABC transporter permease [Paenibacillus sp. FSL H8-0034]|uniref:ABC transporter permease n=1 Tax=Paenibacillus sp. FSL H8-0034 TaxID=2954671 RepID=UPI0030FB146C